MNPSENNFLFLLPKGFSFLFFITVSKTDFLLKKKIFFQDHYLTKKKKKQQNLLFCLIIVER